jgi:hypothetical protein
MSQLFPIPIFLGVTVVLLGVLAVGRRLFPGTAGVRRAFKCPFLETNVSVDFKRAVWDDQMVDVTACSAFSPPDQVRCEKECLRLKEESMTA